MMTTQDWKTCREIRMNELGVAHVDFQFAEILKFIGYGLLGVVVWILKKFGEQHLSSMKELANELKEMRKELNVLSTRVTAVEIRTHMLHPDEPK
jgi:hypothetical protein